MREYKFRAWIKNEEIMIDESDFYDYTIVSNGKGFGIVHNGNWLNKEDFVIMQYVGLKDKNGVEIYEGDIVNLHPDANDKIWYRTIEWDTAAFHCKQIHGKANHPLHFHKHNPDAHWIVIGNIYQNPELLK